MASDEYFESHFFMHKENLISNEIIHRKNINHSDEKYKHFIDARQPGSGKTKDMLKLINENINGKDLVIASSHQFLEEEFKDKTCKKVVILKGFTRACRKYNNYTKEGKIIQKMHKKKIPNKYICSYMRCKGACAYRNQFQQAKKEGVSVGMPIEFLHIIDFTLFDAIFIEERVQGTFSLKWDKKEIKKELLKLTTSIEPEKRKQIFQYINNKDLQKLSIEASDLNEEIESHNFRTLKNFKKNKGLVVPDDLSLHNICKLKIDDLLFYLELEGRDKDNILKENNSITLTYQQFLFYNQLKSNTDLRYNCATFPKNEFLHNLKKFETLYPEYTGMVQIESSHQKNKNVKLIKMSDSGHYKSYLDLQVDVYKPKINKIIKNEKYNKKNKVCILTYKSLVKDGKFMNVDAFWFGASHGVNKYRKYDVLIVLGTYLPNVDAYKEYFMEHHFDEDIPNFGDFDIADGKKIPKDERLYAFYKEKFEDDVYDSVHRLRPLWRNDRKQVTIYWFGHNIPERLKEEFDYQEK